MQDRICEVCGVQLTGRRRRFCSKLHARRVHMAEARARGAAYAQNVPPEERKQDLTCDHCGTMYRGYRSTGPEHKRTYCSPVCQGQAKADRYTACTHGTTRANECPACTFMVRAEQRINWRNVLRDDVCSYCGTSPCNGIDHIDPAARHSDRADQDNWTGCCKRCNELKNTLPLLPALPWIPLAEAYHDMRRALYATPTRG